MNVLNIFHVLVAIAMVAFILVQRGPGATAGAAFGSGASGTVFGSRGAGSFLSRSTWVLASLFCLISLVMAVVVSRDLAAPETDLGVVGATAPVEAPIEAPVDGTGDGQDGLPAMDDPDSDLPMIDLGEVGALDDAEGQSPGPAGDLPDLETAPEDAAATASEAAEDEGPDGGL
jgi:preprotein translocase subunit SecG